MTGVLHIVLARKPVEGTVAENCLQWGCGALWIDGCRVVTTESLNGGAYAENGADRYDGAENWRYKRKGGAGEFVQPVGRFPANLILGGCAVAQMGEQSGEKKAGVAYEPKGKKMSRSIYGATNTLGRECGFNDTGTAARFFFNFAEQESDE